MNTGIKIIILVLSVTLAIGGVMWYAKTRVSPPAALKQVNQYIQDFDVLVKDLSESETQAKEDEVFATAVNRVSIFQKEEKIEAVEADKMMDKMTGSYAPLFLKRCFERFQSPVWSEADHNYMLARIAILKDVKHSDGTPSVNRSTLDSMNTVGRIISDYRDARRVSRSTSFGGLSRAKVTIRQARQYATAPYLSNCRDLVAALGTVKSRLGESHYNYLRSEVSKLGNYYYYSKDYYQNVLIPQVDRDLNEYDDHAAAVYGRAKQTDALWFQAKQYVNDSYQQ